MVHGKNWDKVQNSIQYGSAIFSITINTFLIILILKKSPKRLGTYKNLMIFISVFEIFYSIMDVLVSPVFHSHGSSYLLYVDLRKSLFNRETALFLHIIYCGCFGFSMAIFGIHFIYRYMVATGSQCLKTFKGWRITWWLLIPFMYGLIWGLTSYFFGRPDDVINENMSNYLLELYDVKIEETTYIGVAVYPKDKNGQPYVYKKPAIGLTILILVVTSSIFTILYFGIKCYVKIQELVRHATYSASYAGLQSQLFFSLVTQALIPLVLMHIPISAIFVVSLLGKDLGVTFGILTITVALYPAIDPLPTILIIKNYRKATYVWLRRILTCQLGSKRDSQNVFHL